MSFRTKLFLAIASALILTIGAGFASVWVLSTRSALRDLDDALLAEAEEEVLAIKAAGSEATISTEPVGNDLGERLLRYGAVYKSDGTLVASTPSFACGVPKLFDLAHSPKEIFNFECGQERLRGVFARLSFGDDHLLLLAVSRAHVEEDGRSLVKIMLGALALSLALVGITARFLAAGLAREQEEIARTVRKFAEGDHGARIRTTSSDPAAIQLSLDVNEMIERLGALLESQERFIANAAHELRSPVTALDGELSLALRKAKHTSDDSSSAAADYLETIAHAQEASQQLKALVQDLLGLAKARRPHEGYEDIDVLELTKSVAARYGEQARCVVVGTAEHAFGQRRDLERLLVNVLENAMRHARSKVDILVSRSVERISIEVADDGLGVSAADRGRLFEPFFRGEHDRARGDGTGLGLAIAREIARAHGGDLILSEKTTGTLFIITLKAAPVP
jgi:signal transduction histidine kinase